MFTLNKTPIKWFKVGSNSIIDKLTNDQDIIESLKNPIIFEKLKKIELTECDDIDSASWRRIFNLSFLGNLIELKICSCLQFDDKALNILGENINTKLVSLEMSYLTSISEQSFLKFFNDAQFIGLESLCLRKCTPLTDEVFLQAGKHFSTIKELDISYNDKISNRSLHSIAQYIVNLQKLKLSYCNLIDDIGIQYICESNSCRNIISLNIKGLAFITNKSIEYIASSQFAKVLQRFIFKNSPNIDYELFAHLLNNTRFPMLQEITLPLIFNLQKTLPSSMANQIISLEFYFYNEYLGNLGEMLNDFTELTGLKHLKFPKELNIDAYFEVDRDKLNSCIPKKKSNSSSIMKYLRKKKQSGFPKMFKYKTNSKRAQFSIGCPENLDLGEELFDFYAARHRVEKVKILSISKQSFEYYTVFQNNPLSSLLILKLDSCLIYDPFALALDTCTQLEKLYLINCGFVYGPDSLQNKIFIYCNIMKTIKVLKIRCNNLGNPLALLNNLIDAFLDDTAILQNLIKLSWHGPSNKIPSDSANITNCFNKLINILPKIKEISFKKTFFEVETNLVHDSCKSNQYIRLPLDLRFKSDLSTNDFLLNTYGSNQVRCSLKNFELDMLKIIDHKKTRISVIKLDDNEINQSYCKRLIIKYGQESKNFWYSIKNRIHSFDQICKYRDSISNIFMDKKMQLNKGVTV